MRSPSLTLRPVTLVGRPGSPTLPHAVAPRPHPLRGRPGLILTALTLCTGSFALLQAAVVPALPEIRSDLGTTVGWAGWTVTIYLLAASVATPLLGKLGDRFGRDRLLFATMAVFVLGSVLSVVAWDIWSLIVFRALQGIGGAAYPLAFSIMRDTMPPRKVGVAMGLVSSTLGIGGGLGLVMSGVIVDHASWRWLMVMGAAFGVLALASAVAFIPRSERYGSARLDIPGAVLLSAGLIMVLVALTQGTQWGWGSPATLGLAGAGAAVLAVWVLVEMRSPAPMVDMRMMRRRPVLMTNLAALFCGVMMYAIFTVLPQFSQAGAGLPPDVATLVTYGFAASVTVSALLMLPGALVMVPLGPLGGVLGRAAGYRTALVVGLILSGLGCALMALFHAEPWQIVVTYAIGAGGVAIAFGAMPKLITDAVDISETGIATGMNTVVRTLGSVIGAQVSITLVANDLIPGTAIPAEGGFITALWVGAGAALIATLFALALPTGRRDAKATTPSLEVATRA
ncbi:MAG: MFS transporter [Miltoncostaeaceae bacterium]